jgi:hypothetical protein
MRSALTRIADLEAKVGTVEAPRRVYAVSGGPSGANPADFIRASGLPVDENRDLIIHNVLMAPSANGPVRLDFPWGWVGAPPAGVRA